MTGRVLLSLMLAACCAGAAAADPAPAIPATAPPALSSTPAADAPASTAPAAAGSAATAPATTAARREPLVVQAPAAAPAAVGTAAVGPSAGNLLQTIFGLCVVLALLAGLAWFLKRFGPRNATGNADLRVVGALNLGGRERIVVVEVGDQWIVVGASPGRINALAQMPRQHEPIAPSVPGAYAPSATSFSEWLKQTIDKRK